MEEKVGKAKTDYATGLHRLEEISDEVHERRKLEASLSTRGVGVGAESTPLSCSPTNYSNETHTDRPMTLPLPWLCRTDQNNTDDCESLASIGTADSLDDQTIENLRLGSNIETHLESLDVLFDEK